MSKLDEHERTLFDRYPALFPLRDDFRSSFALIHDSIERGGKLITCGNGGSAADALHVSGELMKQFVKKRPLTDELTDALNHAGDDGKYLIEHLEMPIPSIALTTNVVLSTAVSNDVAGDTIFAQHLLGIAKPEDTLLAISTSGNSRNVVLAVRVAKAMGLHTVALTGRDGGKLKTICEQAIVAPETETYKIQEYHLPIIHTLCLMLEEAFF